MKKQYSGSTLFITTALMLFLAAALVSCSGASKLAYFKDLPDSTVVHLPPTVKEERVVIKGDRMNIQFSALGAGTSNEVINEFNRRGGSGSSGSTSTGSTAGGSGYLVDEEGMIEFPYIGKIKAEGLTAKQLKANLTNLSSSYIKDLIVDVDFTTYRITVIGEVRGPGTFDLPTQRTTLFEALAAAGDLPRSAKRYNIQLYRDYNGQRTITKFDLRKKSVLNNPGVFQVKPNDVIYVQPRSSSLFKEDFNFVTTIVTLLVSLASVGLSIYYNNNR